MKNLGKMIILIFLVPFTLFGNITASVDSTSVELGDAVTLSLKLSGDDIEKPNLYTICDSDIISSGSQTSIAVVNGKYSKEYILSYQFVPQESCVIEPIELMIDGEKEKTKAIKIKVGEVKSSKDSDFSLELKTDKKEFYVGENFKLTLLLKQKKQTNAVDSKFIPSSMKGFWVKSESKPIRYDDGDYIVTKVDYVLAPQRVGELSIDKAKLKIATRLSSRNSWSGFGVNVKWKTYFSNSLKINVKPLPNGVNLIGDFKIKANVDKVVVNAGEAINITVEVDGDGNLEDIKSFKPYIDGVSVFDEKIVIDGDKLTQKLAFVSDESFTIPPFSIKYFDSKTKKVKTIKTKEVKVSVKNTKPKGELVIKKDLKPKTILEKEKVVTTTSDISYIYIVVATIIGFILGVLVMIIKPWSIISSEKPKKVSIKEPKQLFIKLLPFKDDKDVQSILDSLENHIYSNQPLDVDKKVLKEILLKYRID